MRMVCWRLPLQTADDGGQRAHDLWVLAVAFVASAPPRIPTDLAYTRPNMISYKRHRLIRRDLNFTNGDAGREGPVDASGPNLERRRLADPTRELSVPVRSTAIRLPNGQQNTGDSTLTRPSHRTWSVDRIDRYLEAPRPTL